MAGDDSATARVAGLTVRPIRFTAHPAVFGRMLRGLGAVELASTTEQTVYRAGLGLLAVRGCAPDDARAGLTLMGFECADPDQVALAHPFLTEDADRQSRSATAGDGVVITFDPPADGPPADDAPDDDAPDDEPRIGEPDSALTVVPIWMTTEVSAAAAALSTLGFARRLSSDSGVWVDLAGHGDAHGLVAVHHEDGDADIILAFEYSADLGELQSRMRRYGVDAPIVDENYARTLRLPDPDDDTEIWINEAMHDTYGYQRG